MDSVKVFGIIILLTKSLPKGYATYNPSAGFVFKKNSKVVQFLCLLYQILAELWMRHIDQCLCPLTDGPAV